MSGTKASGQKGSRKPAFAYLRVSSKEQEEGGFSLQAQEKLLDDYAKNNDLDVTKTFIDVETAKKKGREQLIAMAQAFEEDKGKGDVGCRTLLVEKVDRLYRNFHDCVTIADLGLDLHFVKENTVITPNSKSHEKLMHDFRVIMAKNYIDNLSEEVKKGMQEKADEGKYPSMAPVGYINVRQDGRAIIIPDLDSARIVIRLFKMYATGRYSVKQLLDFAHSEGLKSPRTRGLTINTIYGTLRNPFYYGEFIWKGVKHQGDHEPLISKELFTKVQTVMKDRGYKKRGKKTKKGWAFTGLVRCAHCGCSLTAEIQKGRYIYYHCTGRLGNCGEPYVREEVLDRQFADALKLIEMDDEVLDWVRMAVSEAKKDEYQYHNDMLTALRTKAKKLRDSLDKAYVDKLDGTIQPDMFARISEKFTEELDAVNESILRHESASESFLDECLKMFELAKMAYSSYLKQPMSEKRRLIEILCSNSKWGNGKLEPGFRKPFDLLQKTNSEYRESQQEGGDVDPFTVWWA